MSVPPSQRRWGRVNNRRRLYGDDWFLVVLSYRGLCADCGGVPEELHHHYGEDESAAGLLPLCPECHNTRHDNKRAGRSSMAYLVSDALYAARRAGMENPEDMLDPRAVTEPRTRVDG